MWSKCQETHIIQAKVRGRGALCEIWGGGIYMLCSPPYNKVCHGLAVAGNSLTNESNASRFQRVD